MRDHPLRRLLGPASLGYAVLAATAAAYFLVYTTNLGHLPTSFDYLSILNTTTCRWCSSRWARAWLS